MKALWIGLARESGPLAPSVVGCHVANLIAADSYPKWCALGITPVPRLSRSGGPDRY